MKYRAEIDGLRAFAVVPVILFHAGFEMFSGGFVGVDIFFVISGYLITTILINEIEKDSFSIAHFYERRARRILPALGIVMLVSIPFAWLYLTPKELEDYAQSLMAVATFSSNILFWTEAGYFDTAAELKPMLHTWSLAVEEQYYIFFPPLLVLLWKFGRKTVLFTLVLMFVCSLVLGHWGAYNKPSAAFFLLPTRGWEILLGSFCAFYLQYANIAKANKWQNILSLIGFGLINLAIFGFQPTTPTPSLFTLIPTVGVALIILYARPSTWVNACLSWRPFVGIGLISYSAYLWHQPLFAFTRKALHHEVSGWLMLTLSVLSLLLGWLSWRTIEKPFRSKQFLTRRAIFAYSATLTAAFICIGFWGHINKGFAFDPVDNTYSSQPLMFEHDIFLLGDSHAGHLIEGLTHITEGEIIKRTASGCIPFVGVDRMDGRGVLGNCANLMTQAIEEFIHSENYHSMLISAMGPVYLDGSSFRNQDKARVEGNKVSLMSDLSLQDNWKIYEIGMENTFEKFNDLSKKQVYFLLDIPELGIEMGCNPARKSMQIGSYTLFDAIESVPPEECKIPRAEYELRTNRYRELVNKVSQKYPRIKVLDPEALFCDDLWCYGYKEGIGYLYQDADHLSVSGSRYLLESIAPMMFPIPQQ